MDIFGPQFNAANIQRGIDQTNANYGGYGISSSKVILVKISLTSRSSNGEIICKGFDVTIQMKPFQQYFHMVLFI